MMLSDGKIDDAIILLNEDVILAVYDEAIVIVMDDAILRLGFK